MINNTKFSIAAMAMVVSSVPSMVIAEEKNGGFIEDSSLTVLNRNYYFNREHRNGESSPTGNGYSEAWANAIITKFESGFTQGTIGVGVDAFAMIGIKLDTGGGRNGGRSSFDVLPVNSNGEARDEYTKVGGAANWAGISVRCPVLDPAIIEYVAALPSHYKIRGGQTKYLLKKLVHRYIPKEIMDRPKQGFGIPMQSWLLGALKPFVLDYLSDTRIQREGIFKPAKVRALRENFYAGKKISPSRIWFLLMFQMWHERWMR